MLRGRALASRGRSRVRVDGRLRRCLGEERWRGPAGLGLGSVVGCGSAIPLAGIQSSRYVASGADPWRIRLGKAPLTEERLGCISAQRGTSDWCDWIGWSGDRTENRPPIRLTTRPNRRPPRRCQPFFTTNDRRARPPSSTARSPRRCRPLFTTRDRRADQGPESSPPRRCRPLFTTRDRRARPRARSRARPRRCRPLFTTRDRRARPKARTRARPVVASRSSPPATAAPRRADPETARTVRPCLTTLSVSDHPRHHSTNTPYTSDLWAGGEVGRSAVRLGGPTRLVALGV